MVTSMGAGRPKGMREQLAELSNRSGLLRSIQRIRAWRHKDLRILAYHRVMPLPDPDRYDFDLELISCSPEQFREQMLLLKRRFRPIRLSDVAAALDRGQSLPSDAVVVTFDDGYDDNYHVAFPILGELGIPATFFVATGHIDSGRPYAYDWLVHEILLSPADRLRLPELDIDTPMPALRGARRCLAARVLNRMKELDAIAQSELVERLAHEWQLPTDARPRDCRPMTWSQLREMHDAGFEIGSHGVQHRMLSKLSPAEMTDEVNGSAATLQRELGPMPLLLSYPVGGDRAFDDVVIAAVRDAGFALACSYICGTNRHDAMHRYALYRLPVERGMGIGWFAAMLTMPRWMSYPTLRRSNHSGEAVAACFP